MRTLTTCAVLLCACTPSTEPLPWWESEDGGSNDPGTGGGFDFGSDAGFCGGQGGSAFIDLTNDAVRAPPAISGGTMIATTDGTLVVADSDRDLVWLVRGSDVRQAALPPGSEPGRVTEGPSGHALIALRRGGSIADLDVVGGTIASMLPVCNAPRGVAWNASTATGYVACADGTLVTLAMTAGNLAVQAHTFIAADLRDVVVQADGLLLTTFRQAHVLHVNPAGEIATLTNDDAFPPPSVFPSNDFSDAGDDGFDGGFRDTFNRTIAWRMVATPGGALIVHQRSQATPIQGFSGTCSGGGYGSVDGHLGTVHTAVDVVANGVVSNAVATSVSFDRALPVDIAVSEYGQVAVISAGGSTVDVMPSANLASGFRFEVEGQPTAVAFVGSLAVVFTRQPAQLVFFSSELPDSGFTETPVQVIPLPGQSVASAGHAIFHTATSNQIACASCHPEAGDDSHVWQLSEGARRTPSLRGGLTGTAPFHWSGDQADMNALMDDVFVQRMGGSPQSPQSVQLLQTWLDDQPILAAPPTDAAKVEEGRGLFATACSSCHAGEQATNNTTVDVGTGGLFQVPRLHELWYRAPFMHDGRAATLADRFGPAGGASHGDVSALSSTQLAALLEYLKSR